jgi:hypothetical protein
MNIDLVLAKEVGHTKNVVAGREQEKVKYIWNMERGGR